MIPSLRILLFLPLIACSESGLIPEEKELPGDEDSVTDSRIDSLPPDDSPPDSEPEQFCVLSVPDAVAWDCTEVGETGVQALVVQNSGLIPCSILEITADSGAFVLENASFPVDIPVGEEHSFDLRYTATDRSGGSALLTVSPDSGPSLQVQLQVDACPVETEIPFFAFAAPDRAGIAVLRSQGNGSFDAPDYVGTARSGWAGVVIGDDNGDGFWEVYARADDDHLYRYDSPLWTETDLGIVSFDPTGAGDLNGDGALDLYGLRDGSKEGDVLLGDGQGNFLAFSDAFDTTDTWTGYSMSVAYHSGDLTGDGRLDLVVVEYTGMSTTNSKIWIYEGLGDGSFLAPVTGGYVPTGCNGVDVADLDNDGFLDVICGGDDDGDGGQLYWLPGDGSGLGTALELADATGAEETGNNNPGACLPRLHDWDSDGFADLLVAMETDPYQQSREAQSWLSQGGQAFSLLGRPVLSGKMNLQFAVPVP
jgi:hypothetical protein